MLIQGLYLHVDERAVLIYMLKKGLYLYVEERAVFTC
jgi:hypothetical protein